MSNLFSAFSGGGAGIIQLPAILLLFEISFPVALATHKISTVLLGLGASLKFFEKSKPSHRLLSEGIMIGLPAVIIGAYSISFINENLARQNPFDGDGLHLMMQDDPCDYKNGNFFLGGAPPKSSI